MVEDYRAARDAWQSLRESGVIVTGVAGTSHAAVAAYQLTDDEFASVFPPPLFKDWLEGNRAAAYDDRQDVA